MSLILKQKAAWWKTNQKILVFYWFLTKNLLSNLIRKTPPEVTQIKNLCHDKYKKFIVKPNNFCNLNILQKQSKKCWKGPSINGISIFQGEWVKNQWKHDKDTQVSVKKQDCSPIGYAKNDNSYRFFQSNIYLMTPYS